MSFSDCPWRSGTSVTIRPTKKHRMYARAVQEQSPGTSFDLINSERVPVCLDFRPSLVPNTRTTMDVPSQPDTRSTSTFKADVFTPLNWSMKEIKDAIPARLFVRSSARSMVYLARDLVLAAVLWKAASFIDPYFNRLEEVGILRRSLSEGLRWMAWVIYWWFQGLVFTGLWVIGHECGHGAFSSSRTLCDSIGFVLHTALWTPYFSWKISHHRHHSNHASMERDEVYVPSTRTELKIPSAPNSEIDWDEIFGDTPIYTLFLLIKQQLLAFPAYLLINVSGQKRYPRFTNHFDPNSIIFNKSQRRAVIISNCGILAMVLAIYLGCQKYGSAAVVKYYGIPWLSVTHWFIMITYLQHTHPLLPHYRNPEWSFQRGAAATVDRYDSRGAASI
ncbi:unnamed protein product [Rhizoctonia solani]|uniref:Fatty acid desaturase domain-containing protein n=1 Tax=Rhizoctonia solani TaxID=456999 RepID=A0A8H3HQ73_9AGAM|nr:unnamed protein product [Rhizoctonia solani]